MAQNKTVEKNESVTDFLKLIDNQIKYRDCIELDKIITELSGEKAKMWGTSIVGYGSYHYKYESGREGDFMRIGFSPRKQNFVLYIINGFKDYQDELQNLGKHKTSKSCLTIKKLEDIDLTVLKNLMRKSIHTMSKRYPKEEA